MSDELLYEVRDGVGTITFNRPQARNALTFAMYEGLAEICETAADKGPQEGGTKALVVCGAGDKAFAAGTDIDYEGAGGALDFDEVGDVDGIIVELAVEGGSFVEKGLID